MENFEWKESERGREAKGRKESNLLFKESEAQ